jgi:iron complex outermembrane receptor protein
MNCQYNSFGTFQFGVRGDIRNFQNNILIMVNSHPLNENCSGAATYTHDTMLLDNVKRIEIIRGPGSALYGANAFSGVINVITREAEDVDGCEFSSRGGSYDTQQYNLLYGKTFNDLDIAFNYNYFNTHGFNKHVDEDMMSIYPLYRKASLAPGRVKGDDEKYDVALNLAYKDLRFDGRYVDRQRDLPVGASMALNNKSIDSFKDYYLNISYERTLWEDLDLMGKVYRNHNHSRDDFQYFPPGVVVSTPWGLSIMKDGMIDIESVKNNRTGFEIQSTYRMSNSNTVVGGITYEEMKQIDTNRRSNYL